MGIEDNPLLVEESEPTPTLEERVLTLEMKVELLDRTVQELMDNISGKPQTEEKK